LKKKKKRQRASEFLSLSTFNAPDRVSQTCLEVRELELADRDVLRFRLNHGNDAAYAEEGDRRLGQGSTRKKKMEKEKKTLLFLHRNKTRKENCARRCDETK
jgi:hypothetical protein